MESIFNLEMLFSSVSFLVTTYFWCVKANKERPNIEFYQLSNFRSSCRKHQNREGVKRLCLQQLDTGGVLAVNHSSRQNSIVLFECFLMTEKGEIPGDWGFGGEDKPPWNIGPETAISLSPACFFDVPEDFEVPEEPVFRLEFITASGKRFSHQFRKTAPRLQDVDEPLRMAA